MLVRVVEPPRCPDEPDRREQDDLHPAKNERKPLVLPERSGRRVDLQPLRGFSEGGTRNRREEEIEFLNNEPERDDCDPGSNPGKERPLVGRVVAVSANPLSAHSCNSGARGA